MIFVDSSVWIDFFANAPTLQVIRLDELIRARSVVVVGDLVLTEVLQGCDTDREFNIVRHAMAAFPVISVVDRDVAVAAARHYRQLRARGITVRKTIDTLIATRCIMHGIPLLYSDRDFDPFVAHCGLHSVLDVPSGAS